MQTHLTFEQAVILIAGQIEKGEPLHVSGDYIKADNPTTRNLIKLLADEYKSLGVVIITDEKESGSRQQEFQQLARVVCQ